MAAAAGKDEVELVDGRFVLRSKARPNYFPHIGCIFVHIPKTGGTSVSATLAQLDEYLRLDGVKPKFDVPERRHHKHEKARVYRKTLEPDIWDASFKFCIVRNPFAQMVSSYQWWLQKAPAFRGLARSTDSVRQLGSFEAFMRSPFGSEHINEQKGAPQDWFLDSDGGDLVDFIVRLEKMEDLLTRLAEHVRIPAGIEIGHRNSTSGAHYSTYYSDALAEETGGRFRYMLDRFGYTFERRPDGSMEGAK